MKITFVSQHFYPDTFSNNDIVRELAARGHEVRVITAVPCYATGRFPEGYSNKERLTEDWQGIARVERVFTVERGSSKIQLVLNYLTFAIMASLRLAKPSPKPDVIVVSQTSPVLMMLPAIVHGWVTGAPVVCWVQDIWPESATFTLNLRNPVLVRPLTWLSGWLYRQPDRLLVQSRAFPGMMERFGIPSASIGFFPNTAPENHVPRRAEEAPDEARLVPQKGFRLMFAGNIGESQDFDTLVAAAERLMDRTELTWVILGTGRDMARAQALVASKGLEERFLFLGRHPSERMPYFFAHADAMLVSLKATQIFELTVPYKVQGYMACGKPIVASLNGEGARIIEEAQCGVVAPASSPEALATSITRLLDAPAEDIAAMGEKARRYFDAHYARSKIFRDLDEVLREMGGPASKKAVEPSLTPHR